MKEEDEKGLQTNRFAWGKARELGRDPQTFILNEINEIQSKKTNNVVA